MTPRTVTPATACCRPQWCALFAARCPATPAWSRALALLGPTSVGGRSSRSVRRPLFTVVLLSAGLASGAAFSCLRPVAGMDNGRIRPGQRRASGCRRIGAGCGRREDPGLPMDGGRKSLFPADEGPSGERAAGRPVARSPFTLGCVSVAASAGMTPRILAATHRHGCLRSSPRPSQKLAVEDVLAESDCDRRSRVGDRPSGGVRRADLDKPLRPSDSESMNSLS